MSKFKNAFHAYTIRTMKLLSVCILLVFMVGCKEYNIYDITNHIGSALC